MKFKFKTQQYQVDAVNAVVNVFKGQSTRGLENYTKDLGDIEQYLKAHSQINLYEDVEGTLKPSDFNTPDIDYNYLIGYANAKISLTDDELINNIKEIQKHSDIPENNAFIGDEEIGKISLNVEMETGTGKTYVYTRTMFELNKVYGWSKFIIVVPSIAIREGVKKSFEQTEDHFMEIYHKKLRYFIYNSNRLEDVDRFSDNDGIHVMIINMQAFNRVDKEKKNLIIYCERDSLQGRAPIDIISVNNPIIIMDEPQKMQGEKTRRQIKEFDPLFSISYSATPRERHNLVYVLDALDAYKKCLVKKIEVKGISISNYLGTSAYLYLREIIKSHSKPQASIELEVQHKNAITRETRLLGAGDSLYEASHKLKQYEGWFINDINVKDNYVELSNGDILEHQVVNNDDIDNTIRRIQIKETIISHLEKENQMYDKGIKVLSLFFIDEVKKYRQYDEDGNQILGEYGKIFEEEYREEVQNKLANDLTLSPSYRKYLESINVEKTHDGYFSIDKKGHAIDTKKNESDDESAYDLILKHKEKLLSFEEPTRFIFSHSALREGWDNPNVFQICALKKSSNDIQRRQEVGRGLRICLSKNGDRMDIDNSNYNRSSFFDINKLTVVTNESYENFVKGLQSEIKENLFNRVTRIKTPELFLGKSITINNSEEKIQISEDQSREFYNYLVRNNYINDDGIIEESFNDDIASGNVKELPKGLTDMSDDLFKLVKDIYNNNKGIEIENACRKVVDNKLNDYSKKKEFLELWNLINKKYTYTVKFNSENLIINSIESINKKLSVSKLMYTLKVGEQKEEMSKSDLENEKGFVELKSGTQKKQITNVRTANIKYDLIKEIVDRTTLTRRTIARILKGIDANQFALFKENPQEFIDNIAKLINEQKVSIIVEHISYDKTSEEPFTIDIFNEDKQKVFGSKAYKAMKHIQDYVTCDSKNEMNFVKELDESSDVVVYAKLPKKFYIPTPFGRHTPDWAIAFNKNNVKHVYFVAETKGNLDELELRPTEQMKIQCAKQLFKAVLNGKVVYDAIDNFNALYQLIVD